MTFFVGLQGVPNAGKDTIANILVGKRGWQRISIGDLIRKEASLQWDVAIEVFTRRDLKEEPHPHLAGYSPREVLINIGQDRKLAHGDDYWAHQVLVQAARLANLGAPGIILTDVGNQVEADYVRLAGGIIIRLNRDVPVIADGRQLIAPDFVVDNNGAPDFAAKTVLQLATNQGAIFRLPDDAAAALA